MNHLVKNSLTRLASVISPYHFRPGVAHYYRFCSHFSGNDFEPESWKSMEGLVRCPANHVPLSPIVFLERAAKAYTDRTSLVYGCLKYTWAQTHERCLKLASALTQLGISPGDVVSWFFFFGLFNSLLSVLLNCFLFLQFFPFQNNHVFLTDTSKSYFKF